MTTVHLTHSGGGKQYSGSWLLMLNVSCCMFSASEDLDLTVLSHNERFVKPGGFYFFAQKRILGALLVSDRLGREALGQGGS